MASLRRGGTAPAPPAATGSDGADGGRKKVKEPKAEKVKEPKPVDPSEKIVARATELVTAIGGTLVSGVVHPPSGKRLHYLFIGGKELARYAVPREQMFAVMVLSPLRGEFPDVSGLTCRTVG